MPVSIPTSDGSEVTVALFGTDGAHRYYISTGDATHCEALARQKPGRRIQHRRVYQASPDDLLDVAYHYTQLRPARHLTVDCSWSTASKALWTATKVGAGRIRIDGEEYPIHGADFLDLALLGVRVLAPDETYNPAYVHPSVRWAIELLVSQIPFRLSVDQAAERLVAANPAGIDPQWALDALEKAAEQRRSLVLHMTQVPSQPEVEEIADDELGETRVKDVVDRPDRIFALTQPTGGRKTKFMEHVAQAVDGFTVYVAPVITLTEQPFHGLDHYQRIRDLDPHMAVERGVRICAPSLPRWSGLTTRVEVLAVDEISQVLSAIYTQKGLRNRRRILGALKDLIQAAKYVLVADADLDQRALDFLADCGKPITVLKRDQRDLSDITATFVEPNQALAQALRDVEQGVPTYIAMDKISSANAFVESVRESFERLEKPAPSTLLVTSDTTGDADVKRFLANPGAADYDLIVSSPALVSGVSLVSDRYTRTYVIGQGVVPHKALVQMARRNRCAQELIFGIGVPRVGPLDRSDLAREEIHAETRFDRVAARYHYDHEQSRRMQAAGVWYLLESQGVCCRRGERDESLLEQGAASTSAGLRRAHARYQAALLDAEPLTDEEATAIRQTRELTSVEKRREERASLEAVFGLADNPDAVTQAHVAVWDHGRLEGRLERMKIVRLSEEAAAKADQAERHLPQQDRKARAAQRRTYQKLLQALHITLDDTICSERPIDNEDARQAFAALDHDDLRIINRALESRSPITMKRVEQARGGPGAHGAPAVRWIPTANRVLQALFGFKTRRLHTDGDRMCYTVDPKSVTLLVQALNRTSPTAVAESGVQGDRVHRGPRRAGMRWADPAPRQLMSGTSRAVANSAGCMLINLPYIIDLVKILAYY